MIRTQEENAHKQWGKGAVRGRERKKESQLDKSILAVHSNWNFNPGEMTTKAAKSVVYHEEEDEGSSRRKRGGRQRGREETDLRWNK